MNKRLKQSLTGVAVLAFLVTAAPVLADDINVEGENSTTGQDSDNDNDFDIKDTGDVKVTNDAKGISNVLNGAANTGGNDQDKNTEAGGIDSGTVDASTDWETVVNSGAALAGAGAGGDLDVTADFVNDTTGQNSDNDNDLKVKDSGDLELKNLAGILNMLGLNADTGNNSQKKNTTAGDIDTGGVGVDAGIVNDANNDSGFAGASAGSLTVDVKGSNGTTGQNSDNDNNFNIKNTGDVKVTNKAALSNVVNVAANTGGNDQKKNTTAGDIDTGDVDVNTDVENSVNNGSSLAGAGGQDLDVTGDFVNDTTGQNSDNDNNLEVKNSGDTKVENEANVDNSANVEANTGDNNQNSNTTGGDVNTGDVSIEFNTSTDANNS